MFINQKRSKEFLAVIDIAFSGSKLDFLYLSSSMNLFVLHSITPSLTFFDFFISIKKTLKELTLQNILNICLLHAVLTNIILFMV